MPLSLTWTLLDSTGNEEFYVQVYAPKGYHFSGPAAPGDGETDAGDVLALDGETGATSIFKLIHGETYTANAGLILSCDPSLGYITSVMYS